MRYPLFQTLDLSNKQRVFAVGDLHGEFLQLNDKLAEVSFDVDHDVLISLGDLVDRGPHSEAFEDYLVEPWFVRILGNHDEQPREYLLGYESAESVSNNGGDWFLAKSRDEQERLAALLEDAPLLLEVLTPGGNRVGFAHADVGNDWNRMREWSADPKRERFMIDLTVGSRETIRTIQNTPHPDREMIRVQGIDHVFHGHTPVKCTFMFENRTWIDTMMDDTSSLTLVEIDPWVNQVK